MKFFRLILPIFIISTIANAQGDQHGIIYPDLSIEDSFCCSFFPMEGNINIYAEPNGNKIGQLVRKTKDHYGSEDLYTLIFVSEVGDTTKLEFYEDMKEVGYEKYALTFYERKDGFIKVLSSMGNKWIKISDINAVQLRALNYQEFMVEKTGKVLGFYVEEALNLRKEASASSEKVETLSFNHEISLTGNHKGHWSEVKVVKLKKDRCEGEEDVEEYELEGWIKVLDSSGNLNIWFYTRGC